MFKARKSQINWPHDTLFHATYDIEPTILTKPDSVKALVKPRKVLNYGLSAWQ